ncbi:MAG: universal stress protein [Rhodospirillaceae bacterium]|nr:universal stress protein [Rhodospirillaceae bacterium]
MSRETPTPPAPAAVPTGDAGRTFLVVVDRSVEFRTALRFACRRVLNTGGKVALFHAVPHSDYHHFAAIEELMRHEAKTEAERRLQQIAADVHKTTGRFPDLHLRQGDTLEQLFAVIGANPSIDMLVLGASVGPEGPGPIISALSGKLAGKILIPVTIVPGDLREERIDALT